jgi:DNA ligase 1
MPIMQLPRRQFIPQCLAFVTGFGALIRQPLLAQTNTAPPTLMPLHARNAPANLSPQGYLISEKLDGVRALWDGTQLRFRSGGLIPAPSWFTAKLPATPLDGELWMGRGQFDALSGAVRQQQPDDALWRSIRYMVFDQPAGTASFSERLAELRQAVASAAWPQLVAVEHFTLDNSAQLAAKLTEVVAAGGEGLVLHHAQSRLANPHNDQLYKLKPLYDAEATVVGHTAGHGKYQGMLGALEVQTDDGQRFKIGTGLSDAQRQSPPAIGSRVTYSYQGLTPSGKPRFARFVRLHSGL